MFQNPSISHIYDEAGTRLNIKQLLTAKDKAVWGKSMSVEIGHLAQDNDYGVKTADTIDFIPYAIIQQGMKVTYAYLLQIINLSNWNLIRFDISLVAIN